MTEKNLRQIFVATAEAWLGCNVADGTHKKIIDLYNSRYPLPRSTPVKYTDAWCATFVSAVSYKAGLNGIIPPECGCEKMTELLKIHGSWHEDESYIPQTGDIIFYDWQDNGVGDCTGYSDHVGIVVEVIDGTIKTIEGNINIGGTSGVGYRTMPVNARYIRGYGIPDYASLATPEYIGDPSEWARVSCAKAVNNKIFHGDGTGFRWTDGITREELCVVLDNLGLLG